MSSGSPATPAAAPGTTHLKPNQNFGALVAAGPRNTALLSVVLLMASAHRDFGLRTKETTLFSHPDSFKSCLQQVVGESTTAYLDNHNAFDALHMTLIQLPRSVNDFFALLNEASPEEVKFLGQGALADIAKLVTKSVALSEQAEKTLDRLHALIKVLHVDIRSRVGAKPLPQATQGNLDPAVTKSENTASLKALNDFQAHCVGALKQLQGSSQLPNGAEAQMVAASLVWSFASSVASAAEQFNARNTPNLDDTNVPTDGAEVRQESELLRMDKYLHMLDNNYNIHKVQINQITELLQVAQRATNSAGLEAVETLRATLSSSVLDIVNHVSRVVKIYVQVSNEHTLVGQRKLGEMIQFSTSPSPQDDKAFMTQLEAKQAEILKENEETTAKLRQLVA